ncbi:MAG: hypothetical protein ABSD31_18720 [Candidatus Binataceae bacterium]
MIKVFAGGESQAAAGLKEALVTSTVDAVHLAGRTDGYFANREKTLAQYAVIKQYDAPNSAHGPAKRVSGRLGF